ncbi:MAG: M20/M25/M40 family metallo-hydrolase [Candidatus Rifleibacteriota bacterium]
MNERQLIELIKKNSEENFENCIQLLTGLISCKSYSGQEKDCADLLLKFCRENEIAACRDSRGSIIAVNIPSDNIDKNEDSKEAIKKYLKECKNSGCQILAYNAHMDVVPAENTTGWESPPFEAVRKKGRIYGRGTCDMKGALASMAVSLRMVKDLQSELSGSRVVVGCFCTEEEAGEGLGFRDLCEEFEFRPDMVLLGEPSQMQIARGQRGKLEFFVDTRGKAVHTSVPETGESALYKMAKALLVIERLELEEREKHGLAPEKMLKRSTLVATNIQSWPDSTSFVPNKVRIQVTVRTALDCSMKDIKGRLQKSPDWPADAEFIPLVYLDKSYTGKSSEWTCDHPAWETSADHKFFQTLKEVYYKTLKVEPVDKIWPFSTDGVYSAGMAKIPTLGLGPGREDCAHIVNEWVSQEQILQALIVYTALPFAEKII